MKLLNVSGVSGKAGLGQRFFMGFSKKFSVRRLAFLIGGAVVIALVVVAVRHFGGGSDSGANGAAAAANAGVPVTATTAIRKDVPNVVNTIGTVQSIDSVAVQARVTGAIQKIEFTPGQDVKQGQELFLIDPRPYQAALDQAQAQFAHDQGVLAEAELDLTRYQKLAEQNSIAKQQAEDQVYVVEQDKGTRSEERRVGKECRP